MQSCEAERLQPRSPRIKQISCFWPNFFSNQKEGEPKTQNKPEIENSSKFSFNVPHRVPHKCCPRASSSSNCRGSFRNNISVSSAEASACEVQRKQPSSFLQMRINKVKAAGTVFTCFLRRIACMKQEHPNLRTVTYFHITQESQDNLRNFWKESQQSQSCFARKERKHLLSLNFIGQ